VCGPESVNASAEVIDRNRFTAQSEFATIFFG
jgi:hypothetical protein